MKKRMKGFTCCGDCIHYNYKKHKCNLGASIETDARNPFYDDCPIPDIPNDKEILDKAIDEFAEKLSERLTELSDNATIFGIKNVDFLSLDTVIYEIGNMAEQVKEVGE